MGNKKTLYEVLNVLSDASFERIQAEHQSIIQKLESGGSGLSLEDAAAQLKLANMAFQVLRDNMSRAAYDAKLKQESSLALVPKTVDTEALTMKMEAAVLKADAAAMMAQAAMINANALSVHYAGAPQGLGAQASSSIFKNFRFAFTVLGVIVAISMAVMVFSGRRGSSPAVDVQAQEKIMLQEYFQSHGVRPKDRAEMALLDAQRRQDESERRSQEVAARNAERQADKSERDAQRFKDEAEKLGKTAQDNLQRGEEQARQLAREEDYKKQQELDRIARDKDQKKREEDAIQARLREYRRGLGLSN